MASTYINIWNYAINSEIQGRGEVAMRIIATEMLNEDPLTTPNYQNRQDWALACLEGKLKIYANRNQIAFMFLENPAISSDPNADDQIWHDQMVVKLPTFLRIG